MAAPGVSTPSRQGGDHEPRRRLLVLVALCGFAFAQPLLSALGEEPTVLVRHGVEGLELLVVGVVLCFVPPLVLWGLVMVLSLVAPKLGRALFLVIVGVLVALFAIQAGKAAGMEPGALLGVLAVASGALFVLAYVRLRVVALWSQFAAVLPILAIGMFVLASPASALLDRTGAQPAVEEDSDLPTVVMIVLDELPTRSLLDAEGEIDRVRFPNLAELGDDATWYRHHTSLAPLTAFAVPSLLSGTIPKDVEPLWTSHPDNLFTLLADTHRLHAFETGTQLCPYSTCTPASVRDEIPTPGVSDLFGEVESLWRERVSLGPERAEVLDDFSEIVESDLAADRVSLPRVDAFIDTFGSDPGPALHYLHLTLPHQPWRHEPDGTVYAETDLYGLHLAEADRSFPHSWAPWIGAVTEQRHLLQAQYADQILGEILDALRDDEMYDDALVIVTSDHGVSFETRTRDRYVVPDTVDALSYAPLIVKLPGQREGIIDDSNVQAIDVVPTIADALGIPVDWDVDGVVAGSSAVTERGTEKVIYPMRSSPFAMKDGAISFDDAATFPSVAQRWIGPLGPDDDPSAGLARLLDSRSLIGQRLDDLQVATGGGRVRIGAVDALRQPGDGPPFGLVDGIVRQPPPDGELLLAVNGVIVAGSELSTDSDGQNGRVSLLIPTSALKAQNDIRAVLATDAGLVELEIAG